jgi:hypothetical protein
MFAFLNARASGGVTAFSREPGPAYAAICRRTRILSNPGPNAGAVTGRAADRAVRCALPQESRNVQKFLFTLDPPLPKPQRAARFSPRRATTRLEPETIMLFPFISAASSVPPSLVTGQRQRHRAWIAPPPASVEAASEHANAAAPLGKPPNEISYQRLNERTDIIQAGVDVHALTGPGAAQAFLNKS